jgi:hypothetical protein
MLQNGGRVFAFHPQLLPLRIKMHKRSIPSSAVSPHAVSRQDKLPPDGLVFGSSETAACLQDASP